jgi:hypothetical protein
MPPCTVTVHLVVGEPVLGGWCLTCLLPSLARVPPWQLSRRGMSLVSVMEACDREGTVRWLRGGPELLRFPDD